MSVSLDSQHTNKSESANLRQLLPMRQLIICFRQSDIRQRQALF